MRPRSEEATALLQTALRLSAAGRGVTLAELAAHAQVGKASARVLVPKLKRRGQLRIVGLRRVTYRNRPVAEYAPALTEATQLPGWVEVGACLAGWAKAPA
ncbi:hypothetical protein RCH06_001848 [Polaromonas sp. CG_9.5]|uniref:hypothetical protein n=1 Tax=Polaromonas sp. CG_9.5 TaxID=3071705 RepID=UPI002DFCB70F|nr:hypothetical protein [Polaromonas sp. CG_9.5]